MYKIYSVMDRKLREFGQLMLARTEEAMLRELVTGVRSNPESYIGKYPEDFDLYHLGWFNPETGELTHELGGMLGNVAELVARFNVKEGD